MMPLRCKNLKCREVWKYILCVFIYHLHYIICLSIRTCDIDYKIWPVRLYEWHSRFKEWQAWIDRLLLQLPLATEDASVVVAAAVRRHCCWPAAAAARAAPLAAELTRLPLDRDDPASCTTRTLSCLVNSVADVRMRDGWFSSTN